MVFYGKNRVFSFNKRISFKLNNLRPALGHNFKNSYQIRYENSSTREITTKIDFLSILTKHRLCEKNTSEVSIIEKFNIFALDQFSLQVMLVT